MIEKDNPGEQCLWSTYRPGPYFGLRANVPDSPLFGIMWYYPEKKYSVKNMRHFLEISDNISKYEWKFHNGCNYGELVIEDEEMFIKLNISFVNEVSDNRNHFVVSIKGSQYNLKEGKENKGIVLMWYLTNPKGEFNHGVVYDKSTLSGSYKKNKKSNDSTEFFVKNIHDPNNKHPVYDSVAYNSDYFIVLDISEDKLYDPSEYIISELKDIVGNNPNHLVDPNDSYRSANIMKGNVYVHQMFLIEDFRVDVHFFDNDIVEKKLDINYVNNMILANNKAFEELFSKKFEKKLIHKINIDPEYLKKKLLKKKTFSSQAYEKTAKSTLSSLLSNMLYMNGNLYILNPHDNSVDLSNEMELLTIGPDKTSHSRGFMWDEGFQQRILSLWDIDTSLKIISNWFQNVDDSSGWLAREIALDNESRSRAPPSAWTEIPNVSNPPSLFLFVDLLFERRIDSTKLQLFLLENIEKIKKNAQWYLASQESPIANIFSWKGKTDDFCLPSGLDDYPRCRLEGKGYSEGHLDLQSWMVALSRTMIRIYKFLGEQKYSSEISKWKNKHRLILNALIDNFWDESTNKFDDFYFDENNKRVFCGHIGYMQLFPLILDIFDDSFLEENLYPENNYFKINNYQKYIDAVLNYILNPEYGLRTDYGIRSLSIKDPFYTKGQNYWTSPIWININYLILKSLNKLKDTEQYSKLLDEYNKLRSAVVDNMVRNFEANGFIWEVYDDITGDGKYNHPFTGWSALIVNLIYELY